MAFTITLPFIGSFPITQAFGVVNPMEPTPGHIHQGVDYGTPTGTQLFAPNNATVTYAGWDSSGYGNLVKLDYGNGYTEFLGHLSSVAVSVGQKISAGTLLGLTGSTGNSTGPHVHVQVDYNGGYVNPVTLQSGNPASTASPPSTSSNPVGTGLGTIGSFFDNLVKPLSGTQPDLTKVPQD